MTIAIQSMAVSTLGTIEIISGELLGQAQGWVSQQLDQAQDWSDKTFDNEYREAALTLLEGAAILIGYIAGYVYGWPQLQVVRTGRYWLSEAIQAVSVLEGWWSAPFVVLKPVPYPESCWAALAQTVDLDILNYELSWAEPAEEWSVGLS